MGDCNKCRSLLGDAEILKCDGICGKKYHLGCVGSKGISQTFFKTYKENDYFVFLCTTCRNTKVSYLSEVFGKILNMLVIQDERLNRQGVEISKITETYEESRFGESDMKDLKNTILDLQKTVTQDIKLFETEVKEFKKNESKNSEELTTVLEEVKVALKNSDGLKTSKKGLTFADKVKYMNNEPMVIVTPKNVQDNKKTKEDLKNVIDPANIQMNHARDLSKGGLAISCSSSGASIELQKLAMEKMGVNYEVKLTELKKPKIKIIGMSEELTHEEIVTKLKAQNEFLKSAEITVVHKYVGLKGYHTAVLEVEGDTFSKLLDAGRVFIDFDSCRIIEDLHVMRCFKCGEYYHKGKECQNKIACQKCGLEHDTATCNSTFIKCVNCIKAVTTYKVTLDVNHTAYDKNCPMYKRKMMMARKRISYNK